MFKFALYEVNDYDKCISTSYHNNVYQIIKDITSTIKLYNYMKDINYKFVLIRCFKIGYKTIIENYVIINKSDDIHNILDKVDDLLNKDNHIDYKNLVDILSNLYTTNKIK